MGSDWVRAVVLNQEQSWHTGPMTLFEDIFDCHDWGRQCYLHPVERGQRCCSTLHSTLHILQAQESPQQPKIIWPKYSLTHAKILYLLSRATGKRLPTRNKEGNKSFSCCWEPIHNTKKPALGWRLLAIRPLKKMYHFGQWLLFFPLSLHNLFRLQHTIS